MRYYLGMNNTQPTPAPRTDANARRLVLAEVKRTEARLADAVRRNGDGTLDNTVRELRNSLRGYRAMIEE